MSEYQKFLENPPATLPGFGRENDMVQNNAGGFTFKVSTEDRLLRFLILGAEAGTYYADGKEHFRQAYTGTWEAIRDMGVKAVELIVNVSVSGRAPKQDATIFALALAAAKGDPAVRAAALASIQRVCRTPTHLFSFLSDYKSLGGKTGGRAMKRALQSWYTSKSPENLAYAIVKYRQRGGWAHRDVLRLAKPQGFTTGENTPQGKLGDVLAFAAGKPVKGSGEHLNLIRAFQELVSPDASPEGAVRAIHAYGLPREAIPDTFLKEKKVWDALLFPSEGNKGGMPLTALIRNLNRMTISGTATTHAGISYIVERLSSREEIKKARVHPIQFLSAARTYAKGRGEKGSLTWSPVRKIVEALENGFLLAFDAVPKTNLRYYVGLDISGSMGCGEIAGVPGLTPREASAAMTLLWSTTEASCLVKGFSHTLQDLGRAFKKGSTLSESIAAISGLPFGATAPSLIIDDALKKKILVDVFVMITDNEVNSGTHIYAKLQEYRRVMKIPAKLVVIGMTATEFTLADPSDPGMLDVVGFDAAAPTVIAQFAA